MSGRRVWRWRFAVKSNEHSVIQRYRGGNRGKVSERERDKVFTKIINEAQIGLFLRLNGETRGKARKRLQMRCWFEYAIV